MYLKKIKNIVNILNGKFWFKSTERIGSTYFVQVKQKIVDETSIKDALSKKDVSLNRKIDFTKYKILIVDDDQMSLKLSEKIFKRFGFDVSLSTDGNDCIKRIKTGEVYDLIFVDIMMSDFNGLDVLKALKVLEGFKIPPVIAFTANALSGMKEKYLNEGFDDYLEKPLKIDELHRVFNKFFK